MQLGKTPVNSAKALLVLACIPLTVGRVSSVGENYKDRKRAYFERVTHAAAQHDVGLRVAWFYLLT